MEDRVVNVLRVTVIDYGPFAVLERVEVATHEPEDAESEEGREREWGEYGFHR